jgi:hypothetical protein
MKILVYYEKRRNGPMAGKTGRTGRPRIDPKSRRQAVNIRMDPELMRALTKAAKRRKQPALRYLTYEIEARLKESFKRPEKDIDLARQENRVQALAVAVAELATMIERDTGKSWRRDAYTGKAIRAGIAALMTELSEGVGEIEVPAKMKEDLAEAPALLASRENPVEYGHMTGRAIGDQCRLATDPLKDKNMKHFYTDAHHSFWKVKNLLRGDKS